MYIATFWIHATHAGIPGTYLSASEYTYYLARGDGCVHVRRYESEHGDDYVQVAGELI